MTTFGDWKGVIGDWLKAPLGDWLNGLNWEVTSSEVYPTARKTSTHPFMSRSDPTMPLIRD